MSWKGCHHSLEARAKIAEANRRRIQSPESRAKISAARKGRPLAPETRAKIGDGLREYYADPAARAKDAASQIGRTASPETRAKLSAAKQGHVVSPEQRAKQSRTNSGRTESAEWRAKIGKAGVGREQSPEARAKRSETLRSYFAAHPESHHWKGGKRAAYRRHEAARRTLGFTPLNAWFPGCQGHHVDQEQVIYLPRELHCSVFHRQRDGLGMAKINAIAYNFLFKQEAGAAMAKAVA